MAVGIAASPPGGKSRPPIKRRSDPVDTTAVPVFAVLVLLLFFGVALVVLWPFTLLLVFFLCGIIATGGLVAVMLFAFCGIAVATALVAVCTGNLRPAAMALAMAMICGTTATLIYQHHARARYNAFYDQHSERGLSRSNSVASAR